MAEKTDLPAQAGKRTQKSINFPEVKLKDVLAAFWRGIKPKKWLLFILVTSMILGNVVTIITPLFYKQFFDVISAGVGDKTIIAKQLLQIIFWVLGFNGLFWIFYRICTIANNKYEPEVMASLKQQSYDYMMSHSYSFFANSFAGSLVQKINRFSRAFERLTDDLVWNLLPLAVRIISILVVVFFINKWIDLVILVWTIIFLSFNIGFSRWKLKYDIKAAAIDSVATGYLSDTISNQNSIQLFNGFNFESHGYKKVTDEQAKITKFAWNLDAVIEGGQAFLSFVIEFALFYFAIKYWQQGLITIGVFVLLQVYIVNIISQLWGFTRLVRDVYQCYADSKEIVEIMLLPHEIKDVPHAKELVINKGEIEFRNLGFSFNKSRKALENVNLIIKPGEKIALIGPSGAGKTTFVRLLLRLYSPTSGKILIDGQDISEVTQGSLRKNISMVPQDPVLFHRTLAENIAYGKRDAKKEEIEEAAKSAHCDDFIANLPYKIDTYVGERGIKLSGGERQRVAIARAILKNAPILVLDEATSSLDSNSEMLIQDALNCLMRNRTTIVIAHRLSTIQKMDRIVVIDDGRIIEQGSHQELLANENSLYKKLWELQAGGFLKDTDKEESFDKAQDESSDSEGKEEDDEGDGAKAKMVNF
ncbi:MAG: ABC transporter ATP-binding protein [Candidatus Staskawiczbacteria bacterium]|nr:ABC transporter ATP-binding protein [Candidatus Staskawiczbacteria bacterium]